LSVTSVARSFDLAAWIEILHHLFNLCHEPEALLSFSCLLQARFFDLAPWIEILHHLFSLRLPQAGSTFKSSPACCNVANPLLGFSTQNCIFNSSIILYLGHWCICSFDAVLWWFYSISSVKESSELRSRARTKFGLVFYFFLRPR